MLEFLPNNILKKLKQFNITLINEIRLRENSEITLIYNGNYYKIKTTKVSQQDILEIVLNACKRSIYSYDEDIKNGFITTDKGVRIGLAGTFVIENGKVQTIKDFSSLVIRIPSQVKGFASEFYSKFYKGGGVLVISKTGVGKTTFIRDLARLISYDNLGSIVVIDERNEICAKTEFSSFDLGANVDVLTYAPKEYGFSQAIRTLNPNYIVTDELMSISDAKGVLRAFNGGISVIATVHSNSIELVKNIGYLAPLINNRCFNYYVIISFNDLMRKIEVYDKNFNKLCF